VTSEVIAHEAPHAAAAIVGGLRVHEIVTSPHLKAIPADLPHKTGAWCQLAAQPVTQAELRAHAMSVIAGPSTNPNASDSRTGSARADTGQAMAVPTGRHPGR
jgi:hypothetical protein